MQRRSLHILLHWSVVFLILAMVKGGSAAPGLRWTYVGVVALWVGIALVRGPIGRPGPKLSPATRAAYRPAPWGIYAVLAVSAALNLAELMGWAEPGAAWVSLLVLLSIGALHGLFQFWRHTVLLDNALRLILPKAVHRFL